MLLRGHSTTFIRKEIQYTASLAFRQWHHLFLRDVCVCATLQSFDGSEYTLQGPAGGDDITGLSAEPAHYQLLSELGENVITHTNIHTHTHWTRLIATKEAALCLSCIQILQEVHYRKGIQQSEPSEHGATHPHWPAGGCQTDQLG